MTYEDVDRAEVTGEGGRVTCERQSLVALQVHAVRRRVRTVRVDPVSRELRDSGVVRPNGTFNGRSSEVLVGPNRRRGVDAGCDEVSKALKELVTSRTGRRRRQEGVVRGPSRNVVA
jgi:hypothetical protein